MRHPSDDLTPAERERLAPHFTDLDGPVFALVNLPETVKGALFARYSRYPGTLRRLFLEEFADSVPAGGVWDGREGERAAQLYERVFVGYGDDSVAQLGGAHVACEWVSNVLTKVLQRPRLAAYLEQSTRYIAYDAPMPGGGYRYYRAPELGPGVRGGDGRLVRRVRRARCRACARGWTTSFPRTDGEPPAARARAVDAKALDLLRGLLPAASLSHMGIYASGQSYEQLILHLIGHPLPEARRYGELHPAGGPGRDAELRRARGAAGPRRRVGRRISRRGEAPAERWAGRLGLDGADSRRRARPPSASCTSTATRRRCSRRCSSRRRPRARSARARPSAALDATSAPRCWPTSSGERANRRHRPGRGFEALRYRFEIVSDYGAFRDLQRHRMLTVQWQGLTPDLGAGVPEELVAAGEADAYRAALDRSAAEYHRLVEAGHAAAAPYALCLGYRIRYVLDLNAREAMHLIELRSGREGHPAYRAVAHQMHALIAERHPAVAAAMTHVDTTSEPRLERILAEMRQESRRAALAG